MELVEVSKEEEERVLSSSSSDDSDRGLPPQGSTGSCMGSVLIIGRRVFCQKLLSFLRQ